MTQTGTVIQVTEDSVFVRGDTDQFLYSMPLLSGDVRPEVGDKVSLGIPLEDI